MKIFDGIFYKTVRFFTVGLIKLLWNVTILNNQVIPKTGPALIVGNHSSWIDTLLLTAAISWHRHIWFFTGEFILKVPVMGRLVRHLFIIPVDRKQGLRAVDVAIEKLKAGHMVCIFPEGELTVTGKLQRFRNGVAVIQKATNAPVIPFFITGGYDAWSYKEKIPKFFRKIILNFGEPFYPTMEKDADIANEIKEKVILLEK